MDFGRDFKHVGRIFPFRDRPDVSVRVLWFRVPLDTPYVPYPNPFVLRNWDRLEEEPQTLLGTDQNYREPYDGPTPINPPGIPCGSRDQWLNGVLYSEYLAGVYACSCPEAIYMSNVNTVRCDDGSIVVAPHSSDVEVHIDTTHTNEWLSTQKFNPANVLVPAITVALPSGASGSYLQAFGGNGFEAVRFGPYASGNGAYVHLYDQAGNLYFQCLPNGHLTVIDRTLSQGWGVTPAVISPGGLTRTVQAFNQTECLFEGQVTISMDPNATTNWGANAAFHIVAQQHTGYPSIMVQQDPAEGGFVSFLVNNDDSLHGLGLVEVNPESVGDTSTLVVRTPTDRVGIEVVQLDATLAGHAALDIVDFTNGRLCGFLFSGNLWTGTSQAPTGTGVIVKRWPVYNQFGSLLGYLPLYDTL